MAQNTLPPEVQYEYSAAAMFYAQRLTPEHFQESQAQAAQRKITLQSLASLQAQRPDVQVFDRVLLQYPASDESCPGQVVPDHMIVLWKEPIDAYFSYDLPFQPVGPFWILEYSRTQEKRRAAQDRLKKYESELKIPYLLRFDTNSRELLLHHHTGGEFVAVKPNAEGRYPIAELDLEIGMLDGWARFWFSGELLLLPAELQRALENERKQADVERRARLALEREVEALRAQLREAQKKS